MMQLVTHCIEFSQRRDGKARAVCVCGWHVECETLLESQLRASTHDLDEHETSCGLGEPSPNSADNSVDGK